MFLRDPPGRPRGPLVGPQREVLLEFIAAADGPPVIDGVVQFDLPTRGPIASGSGVLPAFVVGPENLLVVPPLEELLRGSDLAAAARLFNPFVLVGAAGSGKSQLARAIVRHWSDQLGASCVAFFTAADFGREFQSATAESRLAAWRHTIRGLRVLVIEDIGRLRINAPIQQELRSTLDAVVDSGGMVVVTSQREPIALTQLDAGLRDRLVAGLTVRLQRPGLAARQTIVRLAAGAKRAALADEQLSRLAAREVAAPAALIGAVAEICSAATAAEIAAVSAEHAPSLKQIIAVAARYFGVTQSALTGPSRRSSLVYARNIVVHLARRLTRLSYADIGRALGGRDHTTAMHADRRLAEQLARDPATQEAIEELDRLLRG